VGRVGYWVGSRNLDPSTSLPCTVFATVTFTVSQERYSIFRYIIIIVLFIIILIVIVISNVVD